jgi:hypothetical protein
MTAGPPDPKLLGRYLTLAPVGLEMAAPVGIGIVLDHYLNWTPWGSVGGAVLGLAIGLIHLFTLANRPNGAGSSRKIPPTPP